MVSSRHEKIYQEVKILTSRKGGGGAEIVEFTPPFTHWSEQRFVQKNQNRRQQNDHRGGTRLPQQHM